MNLYFHKVVTSSVLLYVFFQAVDVTYGKLSKWKLRSNNASRKSLVSLTRTRGKLLQRKGQRYHDAKVGTLTGKDKIEDLESLRRLVNCKVRAEHAGLESRFVICNGKRHRVSSKVRKILRELGTRRDIFPNQGEAGKFGPLYGKPITSFLDDPSLPQPSSTSPHSKYPDLGLFDPGLRGGGLASPSSVLNLGGDHHATASNEPEAPGEDTPQLAPPEQPSEDVPPTVTKSEEPSEDLKKKYGVNREEDEKSESDDDKGDDDDTQSTETESETESPDVSQEQDDENQYKAMEASKLNTGELHDIEKFLHDTNDGASGGTEGTIAAPPGTLLDVNGPPGQPQFAGNGPGESRAAAINEAAREREQDAQRLEQEEETAAVEQSAREAEAENAKAHAIQTQREVDSLGKATMQDATSEANSLGMAGMASNDEMPSSSPIGNIWSSLRNSFYATTQSQLAEMDPTSNNRQKVHKPLSSRTVLNNAAKGTRLKLQRPTSTVGRKSFAKTPAAARSSRKSLIDRKHRRNSTLYTRKIKKSEISKSDEALIPLDVVRNLLLQSKDVKTKDEGKKKVNKRNQIIPFFFAPGIKRYTVNGIPGPSFVPAVHGFGPNNFVQFKMESGYPPMGNNRQLFPSSFAFPLPPNQIQTYNFQGDTSSSSNFMGHPYSFYSDSRDDGHHFPSPVELYNYAGALPGNRVGLPMGPIGMPQVVPMAPVKGKGDFRGFVSVPIVEAVSPLGKPLSPDQAPLAKGNQRSDAEDRRQAAFEFEAISSPQVSVPPKLYKDPAYNPRETEDFHPDGAQPFDRPTKTMSDSFREAEEDTARARDLEEGRMKGASEGMENSRAEEGQGYKRSKEKEKRKHRKEEESPEESMVEKKDGKIVFTKEHIGFGPITVVAKTAKSALEDDDDDDNDD